MKKWRWERKEPQNGRGGVREVGEMEQWARVGWQKTSALNNEGWKESPCSKGAGWRGFSWWEAASLVQEKGKVEKKRGNKEDLLLESA